MSRKKRISSHKQTEKYIDVNIKDILNDKLVEFGSYVNYTRGTVSGIDGLKPIHRRVLYSAFNNARNKKVVSAQIIGDLIANYHPHGDVPIYTGIVFLVQNGLLSSTSEFGNKLLIDQTDPPAYRYTSVMLNNEYLIKHIELSKFSLHYINDLGVKEPLFIPVDIPICLIPFCKNPTPVQGIGLGISSKFPTLSDKTLNIIKKSIEHILFKDRLIDKVKEASSNQFDVEKLIRSEIVPQVLKHISKRKSNKIELKYYNDLIHDSLDYNILTSSSFKIIYYNDAIFFENPKKLIIYGKLPVSSRDTLSRYIESTFNTNISSIYEIITDNGDRVETMVKFTRKVENNASSIDELKQKLKHSVSYRIITSLPSNINVYELMLSNVEDSSIVIDDDIVYTSIYDNVLSMMTRSLILNNFTLFRKAMYELNKEIALLIEYIVIQLLKPRISKTLRKRGFVDYENDVVEYTDYVNKNIRSYINREIGSEDIKGLLLSKIDKFSPQYIKHILTKHNIKTLLTSYNDISDFVNKAHNILTYIKTNF